MRTIGILLSFLIFLDKLNTNKDKYVFIHRSTNKLKKIIQKLNLFLFLVGGRGEGGGVKPLFFWEVIFSRDLGLWYPSPK